MGNPADDRSYCAACKGIHWDDEQRFCEACRRGRAADIAAILASEARVTLKQVVWMRVAFQIAQLGTCHRRKVGAVLLDADGHVLATGYNGPARGLPNCHTDHCPGAHYPSGQGLEKCEAIHAEANALLQCPDVSKIHSIICTDSPCIHCVKLLLNTSTVLIVAGREYSHHSESMDLWRKAGRRYIKQELQE